MGIVTRRSFLVMGVGALSAVAGCSGEEEPTGEPGTTTDTEPSLEIEHPVLCSERPTGYREYTEQPEETYGPGDVVWLYFEPSTTGTEPAGEGEVQFEYEFTISVTDPDGKQLGTVEDTAGKTIPEGSDLSTVFLSASFSPPTEFEAGTHTLEVEVTDTVADRSDSTTVEFEVESEYTRASGEFGFGRFAFLEAEARDYRDYEENPDGEYGPTDPVWYYYEIDGFAYEETSNAVSHDLQLTETLTGPEGEIWAQNEIPLTNRFEPDTDMDTYWVTDRLLPNEEWSPGEYELSFTLTDGYRDETVTETYSFTVVA